MFSYLWQRFIVSRFGAVLVAVIASVSFDET